MRVLIACFVVMGLGLGCDRTHMRPRYGQATRAAFSAQVDLQAGDRPATRREGLDPQEAAQVLKTYRKSLSPTKEDDAAQKTPILMIAPPSKAGEGHSSGYTVPGP